MIIEIERGLVIGGFQVRWVGEKYRPLAIVAFDAIGEIEVLYIDTIEPFMAAGDRGRRRSLEACPAGGTVAEGWMGGAPLPPKAVLII